MVPLNFTKSINLTLSERGIQGLSHSGSPGLLEDILSETIPVYGRMVHGKSMLGTLTEKAMPYDVHGRVSELIQLLRALLMDFPLVSPSCGPRKAQQTTLAGPGNRPERKNILQSPTGRRRF